MNIRILQKTGFVMASANSPLGNSIDAVRGAEVVSCDQSRTAAQF